LATHLSATIVTPCLNRVGMIATAIESVCNQDFEGPVEHLVIDGGSTDGTLEVLAQYPNLTVTSESDENLYDALNKGVGRATGAIVGLLNSDDKLRPDAIRKAVAKFEATPSAAMVCGGADVVDGDGDVLVRYSGPENCSLDPKDLLFGIPIINARFFKRALFDRIGSFDARYKLVADREFLLRAALAGEVSAPLREVVYEYRSHVGSLTIGGIKTRKRLAQDYVLLTENWLGRPALPPTLKKILKRLHARSVLVGAATSILDRNPGALVDCLLRGHETNAWWPIEAAGAIGFWAAKRLRPSRS
jgi:glycosyltransferase involved in cell wall biosynthesis